MLMLLQFRMVVTTPHSFVGITKELLPLSNSKLYEELALVIEYA